MGVEGMPSDCMPCKYQKHIKYQEGRIRYLEMELKAARDEVNLLKNRNMSNKISDKDNANDNWLKPKNSKSRARRFYADDVSHIKLCNKFSILEGDQQNQGLLKHENIKVKVKSPTGKSKSQGEKKILLLGSSHGWDMDPCFKNTWVLIMK